jgi:hypothetical protein
MSYDTKRKSWNDDRLTNSGNTTVCVICNRTVSTDSATAKQERGYADLRKDGRTLVGKKWKSRNSLERRLTLVTQQHDCDLGSVFAGVSQNCQTPD